AAADDELLGPLVVASLEALGLLAPRRTRVAATRRATLATTHRVIDGVHRHAAVVRADALPPHATGLAPLDVRVLGVADLADRRPALDVDPAHLARWHAQRGPVAFLGHQGDLGAGRAADLRAAADLELNGVDLGTDRNEAQRQRVAGLDVGRVRRDHLVAHLEILWREDVALLAVGVLEERQARRAVRVVLDLEHGRGNA